MLPSVTETIKKHGLRQKKSLGQHFLHHPELIEKIARAAGDIKGRTVMEVGPGPGGLTKALLEAGAGKLIAVEKDHDCIAALKEISSIDPRLEIIEADALEVIPPQNAIIVANLPYNVGTAMLINWLDNIDNIASMTLMFQKEVVDRLAAKPREEAYGRLSVITQFNCRVEKKFDIAPSAFLPPPKVTSTVVSLFPRSDRQKDISPKTLGIVTKAAFGQRRKMLRSSLKSLGVPVEKILSASGIDGSKRAEELSVDDFCNLTKAYESARST